MLLTVPVMIQLRMPSIPIHTQTTRERMKGQKHAALSQLPRSFRRLILTMKPILLLLMKSANAMSTFESDDRHFKR